MADKSQKWVLMVTAQTPTNIAVIKYWGKRDEKLILQVNDSISVTLDPAHLCTTTTVFVSPTFDMDWMWLNGEKNSISGGRFQSCLREIRRPLHRHRRRPTDRWQVQARSPTPQAFLCESTWVTLQKKGIKRADQNDVNIFCLPIPKGV
ncbi:hypothetical protein ACFX1X_020400 [Malus domestica]